MEGTEIPIGFIGINKLSSGKSILNTSLIRVIFSFSGLLFSLWLFSIYLPLGIFLIAISLPIFFIFLIEYSQKRIITTSIAVNLGHPWVEEEHDVDEAEVAYNAQKGWEILPKRGRVRQSGEDGKFSLMEGENELVLGTASQKLKSELIRWLNLALAIRDAQNNEGDEIEEARAREDSDNALGAERRWPKLTPGELSIKPGAIFRKFTKDKKNQ